MHVMTPQCPDANTASVQDLAATVRQTGNEVATALHDDSSAEPRSFVASERLGLEPGTFLAILENVGDADCGGRLLDPALHQP